MSTHPFLSQLLNAILTGIIIVDKQFVIHYANTAAQQLLQQSHKKLLGHHLLNQFHYVSLNTVLMERALNEGHIFTDNEVSVIINTQNHILAVTAQLFGTDQILLEFIPLNNQKRISQEQTQYAQQHAARSLAKGLAHEIKNPLGGLRGAAQLLHRELKNTSLTEYTDLIIKQADRLTNLVDRLLGPQKRAKHEQHNIHQIVEHIYKLLSLEDHPNIQLIRDYDPSLPELIYDEEQLEQAILNIALNAFQALIGNDGGHLILRTRTAFQVTMHNKRYRLCARLDIEDNGPGIASHLKETLFYPMVSGKEGGCGLGLSIARQLIDEHKGKIEFQSWPGHTTFSIYLPIKK